MTMTTQNDDKIVQHISQEQEFNDPNVNYHILLTEMRERIVNLQYDLNNIRDPEVLGFTFKRYLELKEKYFNLMVTSMQLEHDIVTEQSLDIIAQNLGGVNNE